PAPGHQHQHRVRLREAAEVPEIRVLAVRVMGVVAAHALRRGRQHQDGVVAGHAHELAAPARKLRDGDTGDRAHQLKLRRWRGPSTQSPCSSRVATRTNSSSSESEASSSSSSSMSWTRAPASLPRSCRASLPSSDSGGLAPAARPKAPRKPRHQSNRACARWRTPASSSASSSWNANAPSSSWATLPSRRRSSALPAGGAGREASAITRAVHSRTSAPPPASQPHRAPCSSAGVAARPSSRLAAATSWGVGSCDMSGGGLEGRQVYQSRRDGPVAGRTGSLDRRAGRCLSWLHGTHARRQRPPPRPRRADRGAGRPLPAPGRREPQPAPATGAADGRARAIAAEERAGAFPGRGDDRAAAVAGAAHVSTEPVEVRILDREYTVGVPAGERDSLQAAARLLDSRMREIRGSNRMVSLDRLAVLAALNLAHELHQAREERDARERELTRVLDTLERRLDGLLGPATEKPQD